MTNASSTREAISALQELRREIEYTNAALAKLMCRLFTMSNPVIASSFKENEDGSIVAIAAKKAA